MNQQAGLVYNKDVFIDGDMSWILDSTSIETWGASWQDFGYEIIFRLEEIRASERIINELKVAFMKPFGLPQNQYRFEPTFWRVYWDQGNLRASMIKECEDALDRMAKKNGIVIRLRLLPICILVGEMKSWLRERRLSGKHYSRDVSITRD